MEFSFLREKIDQKLVHIHSMKKEYDQSCLQKWLLSAEEILRAEQLEKGRKDILLRYNNASCTRRMSLEEELYDIVQQENSLYQLGMLRQGQASLDLRERIQEEEFALHNLLSDWRFMSLVQRAFDA